MPTVSTCPACRAKINSEGYCTNRSCRNSEEGVRKDSQNDKGGASPPFAD